MLRVPPPARKDAKAGVGGGFREPQEGQKVESEAEQGAQGMQASSVRPL
jgi:cold shock CspA family protein